MYNTVLFFFIAALHMDMFIVCPCYMVETLPFLQPAEIQWMYICQKCLVGCIIHSKKEFAVINTSNTSIFNFNPL